MEMTKQTTRSTTAAGRAARWRGHAPRFALALLAALCCHAAALAQSAPSGPAGGDLSGTYPNPTLAADRVRTAGDSMTGALEITLPNAGSVVTPFKLATTGTSGAGRGLALQLHVPSGGAGLSILGGQITSAWDSAGKTYLGFSAYNGSAVAEVLRLSGSGNVGIGTTSPTSRLHVASGSDSSTTLLHLESGAGTTKGGAAFAVSSNAAAESGFDLSVKRAGAFASRLGVSPAGHLYLQPAGGRVGVGTSTPNALLEVQGANAFAGTSFVGSGPNLGNLVVLTDDAQGANVGGLLALGGSRGSTGLGVFGGVRGAKENATDASSAGYLAFYTLQQGVAFAERVRVTSAGSVGIGTTAPAAKLDVQGGQINASGGLCIDGDCKAEWTQVSPWVTSGTSAYYSAGRVGIGTSAPSSPLEVQGAEAAITLSQSGLPGKATIQSAAGTSVHLGANARYSAGVWSRFDTAQPSWNVYASPSSDYMGVRRAAPGTGGVAWVDFLRITNAGNVIMGTVPATAPTERLYVVGDVKATGDVKASGDLTVTGAITGGSIEAKYQDVAEWVPSTQALAAGTVVVLDAGRSNQVLASTSPYDTKVAGVVSARPGIALGEAGEGKVLVATTGRVKVRVDATAAPIRVGDLLVTGRAEGVAMKSVAVELGGVSMHRPGTIIGKALEPLENGRGEILVLLSLQ